MAGRLLGVTVTALLAVAPPLHAQAPGVPSLHHAHLNSVDAQAAIDWYLNLWPAGERGNIAGHPAFIAEMSLLFNEVDSPPAGAWDYDLQRAEPQSPFWHIGAFTNTTGRLAELEGRGFDVLRLWTGPDDHEGVRRSGLTPYQGILNAEQLPGAESAVPREGGFSYLVAPDGALFELTGSPRTTDAFAHIHLFHEEPQCAANWYASVLGMTLPPIRDRESGESTPRAQYVPCSGDRASAGWPSLEYAGTIRSPNARVRHGNGNISFYPRQCIGGRCGDDKPLVSSRGQVLDHIGFSVVELDGWAAHLRSMDIEFEGPYPFGDGRGLIMNGPDGLRVELVEVPANQD